MQIGEFKNNHNTFYFYDRAVNIGGTIGQYVIYYQRFYNLNSFRATFFIRKLHVLKSSFNKRDALFDHFFHQYLYSWVSYLCSILDRAADH